MLPSQDWNLGLFDNCTCCHLTQQNEKFSEIGFFLSSFFFFFLSFYIFRAAPKAHGCSQVRGSPGATAASLHHSHGNAGSLTHWARPGIKPISSWILAGFITCWATVGTPRQTVIFLIFRFWGAHVRVCVHVHHIHTGTHIYTIQWPAIASNCKNTEVKLFSGNE